ncbi:MAG: hypothetical protein M1831_001201 [Alyxoria varia]|nr:MAG: hypothetical protein M1831_001201 [Alyxoria varia]
MDSDHTPKTGRKLRDKKNLKAPERFDSANEDEPTTPRRKKVPVSLKQKNKAAAHQAADKYPTPESLHATPGSSLQPPPPQGGLLKNVLSLRDNPKQPPVKAPEARPLEFAEPGGRQTNLPFIQEELGPFYRELSELVSKNDILAKPQVQTALETTQPLPELWERNAPTADGKRSVDFQKMSSLVVSLHLFRQNVQDMNAPGMPRITEPDCIMAIQNLVKLWTVFNDSINAAELDSKDGSLLFDEADMVKPAKLLDHYRWCMAYKVESLKQGKRQGREVVKKLAQQNAIGAEFQGTKSQGKKPATDPNQLSAMQGEQLTVPVTSDEVVRRHLEALKENVVSASTVEIGDAVQVMAVPADEEETSKKSGKQKTDDANMEEADDEFTTGPHKTFFKGLDENEKNILRRLYGNSG